ncbi:GIY-YIG nuclease family protein, partial [Mariniradius sediminis]
METYFVYILYSPSTGSYYIGQTMDLENRLIQHNSHFFKDSHTKVA